MCVLSSNLERGAACNTTTAESGKADQRACRSEVWRRNDKQLTALAGEGRGRTARRGWRKKEAAARRGWAAAAARRKRGRNDKLPRLT